MNWKHCDLTGKTFGNLVVIKLDHKSKNTDTLRSQRYWMCQCKCGKTTIVRTALLTRGQTKSCGCKKFRRGKNHPNFRGVGDLPAQVFSHIKHNAKNRAKRIRFSVSIDEAWKLFLKQNKKCALSGLVLTFQSKHSESDGTASLDRIDSSLGYVKGNIQWVHKDINIMKNVFDTETFLRYCILVNENCCVRSP